jgi:hypothetical protein
MKRRRILSAVMAASLVTAFAMPAARAADNSDSMPGRMPDHMPGQMSDDMPDHMADHMRSMPGKVTMPLPGYEQSAKILTPTELCKRYERRFDAAEQTHQQAPFIDEARTLRIEGGKLCNSGEQARGIHKLREALGQLGVDAGLE